MPKDRKVNHHPIGKNGYIFSGMVMKILTEHHQMKLLGDESGWKITSPGCVIFVRTETFSHSVVMGGGLAHMDTRVCVCVYLSRVVVGQYNHKPVIKPVWLDHPFLVPQEWSEQCEAIQIFDPVANER